MVGARLSSSALNHSLSLLTFVLLSTFIFIFVFLSLLFFISLSIFFLSFYYFVFFTSILVLYINLSIYLSTHYISTYFLPFPIIIYRSYPMIQMFSLLLMYLQNITALVKSHSNTSSELRLKNKPLRPILYLLS